jgi:hypothetical protein
VLSATQQALRYNHYRHIIILPFCFFLYHFIHGLGVLLGLMKLLLRIAPVQKIKEPWKDAGAFRVWQVIQAKQVNNR